ncbi:MULTISPECIES: hypothetical protein [Streptomycetaceae]|uniref:hypothetical protein n=1 Tax=Streptomycetaceae TaxID=2062 RepID=UPI0012FFBF84|nr:MULTISPECIES: hypothetical protein [Streptomycetaceae]MYS61144.1 hypothetical protein [Streptomyces sp. SID5468]
MRRTGRLSLGTGVVALITVLSACGTSPRPAGPAPSHSTASPSRPAPTTSAGDTDLLGAARQTIRRPAFTHVSSSGQTHWAVSDVRFPSHHYVLRTSCIGKGSLTASATGIGTWHTECTAGEISISQNTQPAHGNTTAFSITATPGVRFAVVAAG